MIPAVILSGGKATRMGGGDKCLLPFGDGTLLDHVLDRLSPQAGEIALNANGDAARFASYGLTVVADCLDGFLGPLAGVHAGLEWAAKFGADRIVTVAGDTPFFPDDLVKRLNDMTMDQKHPLVLARTSDGRHPTFGIWPVALRDNLRQSLVAGLRKVVQWTDQHDGRTALFEDANDPFFNVNTPDDLRRAQGRLK